MPKLVLVSVLLVVVLGYAMAFVSWNSTPVTVVGFRWGGEAFWQAVPVAYLPLVGIGIGVVAMALASLSQWGAYRSQVRKLSGQVQKAREVIEHQKRRISELEAALEQLRAEQAQAAAELARAPDQPASQEEPIPATTASPAETPADDDAEAI